MTTVPPGAATSHGNLTPDVFDAALMAAFPGLPECMTLDEAGRRIAAALNTARPLIERAVREKISAGLEETAGFYDPTIWLPDSQHPDAIAARAMRHAYATAARLVRAGGVDADASCETDDEEGPGPQNGDHGTCASCGQGIEFIDPRDGMPGAWRHVLGAVPMPADHDARLGGPA